MKLLVQIQKTFSRLIIEILKMKKIYPFWDLRQCEFDTDKLGHFVNHKALKLRYFSEFFFILWFTTSHFMALIVCNILAS